MITLKEGQKIEKYDLMKQIQGFRTEQPSVTTLVAHDVHGNEVPYRLRDIYQNLRGWLSQNHLIVCVSDQVSFRPDPEYRKTLYTEEQREALRKRRKSVLQC